MPFNARARAAKPPQFNKFKNKGYGITTDGHSFHIYGPRTKNVQQRTQKRVEAELRKDLDKIKETLDPPLAPPMKRPKADDEIPAPRARGFTGIMTMEEGIAKGVIDHEFFVNRVVYNSDLGQRYATSGSVVRDWILYSFVRVSTRDAYRHTGRDDVERDGVRTRARLGGEQSACIVVLRER